jgi:hypothetical protein
MSDSSSEHEDLKALWQGQPKESDPMSLEHIQAISRRLDRSDQRTTLVMFVTSVVVFFIAGQQWQRAEDVPTRMMWVLWGLGFAGCMVVSHLLMRLRRDPTEPGGVFLRRRLERSLGLARGRNFLVLLPILPWFIWMVVIGVVKHGQMAPQLQHLTPTQVALNWVPVVLLAAIWVGVMVFHQPRVIRRLSHDLDDLNASMK